MSAGGALLASPVFTLPFGLPKPLITTLRGSKTIVFFCKKRTFVISMTFYGSTNANHGQNGPVRSTNSFVPPKCTFSQCKTHGCWGAHLEPSLFTTPIWATKTFDNHPCVAQRQLFPLAKTCIRGFDDFFWLSQCKQFPKWARSVNKSLCTIQMYVFQMQNPWLLGGASEPPPVYHPHLGDKNL